MTGLRNKVVRQIPPRSAIIRNLHEVQLTIYRISQIQMKVANSKNLFLYGQVVHLILAQELMSRLECTATLYNTETWLTLAYFFFFFFLLSLAPQPSLGHGCLHKIRLNFLEASQQFSFLQVRVVSPTPNPHPGGPDLCIYIPQRQSGYPF
jgi:hypothetical protein